MALLGLVAEADFEPDGWVRYMPPLGQPHVRRPDADPAREYRDGEPPR